MAHEILIYNKTRRKIPKKLISDVVLRALKFLQLKQPAELAVLIVDKREIKRLNKIYYIGFFKLIFEKFILCYSKK